MEKLVKIILILVLALAVAAAILLSGCTASDGNGQQYAGDGSAQGNRTGMMRNGSGMNVRGGLGNITDAQGQQMMQAWAAACGGKASGDACAVQSALGGAQGKMNGTCSSRGGNLTCMPIGMGGQPGGNGTGGRSRDGTGRQPPGNGTRGGFGRPPQNTG